MAFFSERVQSNAMSSSREIIGKYGVSKVWGSMKQSQKLKIIWSRIMKYFDYLDINENEITSLTLSL